MPILKGQVEHQRWKNGEILSRKEAILAKCYGCNVFNEGGVDGDEGDGNDNCPVYIYLIEKE